MRRFVCNEVEDPQGRACLLENIPYGRPELLEASEISSV